MEHFLSIKFMNLVYSFKLNILEIMWAQVVTACPCRGLGSLHVLAAALVSEINPNVPMKKCELFVANTGIKLMVWVHTL